MAYATASDVAARNKALVLGVGQNPTVSDVTGFIDQVATELDAILLNKGYTVPVDPANTEAYSFMGALNILGALVLTGEAAPTTPPALDRWRQDWERAKERLEQAKTVLDAPQDTQRIEARGPWLTSHPTGQTYDPLDDIVFGVQSACNNPANPYFSRQQQF